MAFSLRTQQILDGLERVPDHPLKLVVKRSIIDAMTAADQFAAKKNELAKTGTLTERGQHQALRDSLVHQYGKDLARARDPITKARKDIKARRDALVIKAVDPANIAAALERQEIRAWLRTLDLNARQSVALTTKDRRVIEAMVTAPPELSGFDGNLARLAEQVEERYMELTYGDEIAAIKSMEAVVDEGDAAIGAARVLIQGVTDLDDRDFNLLMRPIEQKIGAPWLLKSNGSGGVERVMVVEVTNGVASYRDASANDLSTGVYYKDAAEYQTAQGLAAA
jgi:hypothetical protein